MNERTRHGVMTESNQLHDPQRRRSPRLGSPQAAPLKSDNKMALPSLVVKRSITVRKIAPRKTAAPSEHNKENTPRRSGDIQQKKNKGSTPDTLKKCTVPVRRASSSSAKKKKGKPAMPSPILPSSPPASCRPPQPAADPEDSVWSQKVRRSYSRLSDKSINSPDSRDTLFGFEMLKTPEVARRVAPSRTALEPASGSLSGLNSFTSLLEADDCDSAFPGPDPDIPGVAVAKERRRRRKVPQIGSTELEALAAKMNAEFEKAEEFQLVVE
ncbi:sororin [Odontesthes bonariensis]|uniref:sororin n=1 Tax=Odontesthes bonariensis TaxID=219752 RepID=UPI003F585244